MSKHANLQRWLAAALGAGMVAAVALYATRSHGPAPTSAHAGEPKAAPTDWIMFGGSPTRNMINLVAKNLPIEWSVDEGDVKNMLWSADLGSRAYGGPVIAGNQVYVGTNNQNPRDKKHIKDGEPIDLGILMAFSAKDGKFLWQNVYPK